MKHPKLHSALPRCAVVLALALPSAVMGEATEGEKLFALHVSEILAEKCIACHSPDKDKKLKGRHERESLVTIGPFDRPANS